MKELPANARKWITGFKALSEKAKQANRKIYIVTGQKEAVNEFLEKNQLAVEGILTCDVTSIKTAARANPTMYLMKGPVVQAKKSWADLDEMKN